MRIKKIEIRGFKTFAEATEMEFTPGITAVVGPNGSGKSNISDAIAWVMGESNVRNLRATRTEDVIFNGSANRKPVGLAEVSLTLDNSSGRLPIGFSEVTVTRRAYRSGDSEYFINKVPCRLRDIFELFLDSGAGRGAYSMVSQGEIDELLTGKPEDRRELLEEAAGVKKYRHRRHETYRKLQHTEDNLSRVHDIMQELQAQMEPLAEQAEKAIRFRELTERLKEIEVGLLVSRVQRLDEDIALWKEQDQEIRHEMESAAHLLEQHTQEERETAAHQRESQEKLEKVHGEYSEAQSVAERLRSDLAVAQAKKESAEAARARLTQEIERAEARLGELTLEMEGSEAEAEEAVAAREQEAARVQSLQAEVNRLNQIISHRQGEMERQQSGARELAEDKAAQRSRLESARTRRDQLEAELASSGERLEQLAERVAQRESEAEEAERRAKAQQERVEALNKSLEGAREKQAELQQRLQAATAELESVKGTLLEQSSRYKMLRQLHEAREGYYAGVRAVLAAAKRGDLPDQYQVVADILDVPSHLDEAMEAALGGALQDIVTEDFNLVRRAIEFLKSRNLGRATFLPLDRLERQDIFPADRLRNVPGVMGTAYDLVGCDPRFESVARMLLGRVLVAEDLQSAGDAAKALRGWSKIVTPDGELLLPSGAITGGSRQKKGPALTERKRELSDLAEELKRLEVRLQKAEARRAGAAGELEESSLSQADLQKQAEEARVELAQVLSAHRAASSSRQDLEENLAEARARQEAGKSEIGRLTEEIGTLERMLNSSDEAGGEIEELLARHREELSALEAGRTTAARELQEASSQLSALSEREKSIGRSRESLAQENRRSRQILETRTRELEDLDRAESQPDVPLEELEQRTEAAHAAFLNIRLDLLNAQNEAQDRSREHDEAAQKLQETRTHREEMGAELHEIELSLAKGETELNQALERLWDDYEITRNDAITWPEPLLVKHGTVAEVNRLRREIRGMGEVNTGAVAEFERIRERWEFLATQRADLEEGRDSLLEAIREIDDSTRDLFMDTFNKVREHFSEIFTVLFGGGVARLELTRPDDLLETGIEVFVQPPGKTLQNMDLLSGGEKALTAQALLFALMRVKPSPFCVLDEVDAPLDDANVVRFAQLVKQYAQESQFIVITHNRATMEAADVLYGVTMREPGISSLYGARISEMVG